MSPPADFPAPQDAVLAFFDAWVRRPEARAILREAVTTFFGDEAIAAEVAGDSPVKQRFYEWVVLDMPLPAGGTIASAMVPAPPAVAPAWLRDLLQSRHDVWTIEETGDGAWRLRPLAGGEPLEVGPADRPAETPEPGDVLVGRLYRWEGGWRVAPSAGVLGGLGEAFKVLDRSIDAPTLQKVMHVIGLQLQREAEHALPPPAPADGELERLALGFFAAIEREDEAGLRSVTVENSTVWLLLELWGWAGLGLFASWNGPMPELQVQAVEQEADDVAEVELIWRGPTGVRGATALLACADGRWRVIDVRPDCRLPGSANRGMIYHEYSVASSRGARLPWRSPAPDAVEQKLRNAVAARQLPVTRQLEVIRQWRLARDMVGGQAASQPEAWAAAIELVVSRVAGEDPAPKLVAGAYGARKDVVRDRAEWLARVFEGRSALRS